MNIHNLANNVKVTRVMNAVAGGFGDTQTSSAVDMQGYESVMFIALIGAIAAGGTATVKAAQDIDPNLGTIADLAGTGIAVAAADANLAVVLEITNPQERYVACAIDRAVANVTIDGVIAIQSNASLVPPTHDAATVLDCEVHVSPAEGVA